MVSDGKEGGKYHGNKQTVMGKTVSEKKRIQQMKAQEKSGIHSHWTQSVGSSSAMGSTSVLGQENKGAPKRNNQSVTASDGHARGALRVSSGGDIRKVLTDIHAEHEQRIVQSCRRIAENGPFMGFTTVLTIWALWGDDIRLACTDKPADFGFNFATLFCMITFLFEILVSSIGKPDYFLGFFFWLDLVSTISLILDLSWVNEELFGSDTDAGTSSDSSSTLRAGRASRAGTRAGRIVRIIRLIRIVKLFKAFDDRQAKKNQQQDSKKLEMMGENSVSPGEDDWDLDEDDEEAPKDASIERESRVGRKLSEMTTRRVIILVLAMLFVLPALDVSYQPIEQMPPSAQFAADGVYSAWMKWDKVRADNATLDGDFLRLSYEDALLRFVYYHNWHAGECPDAGFCPYHYLNQAFWIGISGESTRASLEDSYIKNTDVSYWEEQHRVHDKDRMYNFMPVPGHVRQLLTSKWKQDCSKTSDRVGVSFLLAEEYAVACPSDLRYNERDNYYSLSMSSDEFKDLHFEFWFDRRRTTRTEAWLNSLQTIFICIVLGCGAMLFSKDANVLVLNPVEQMIAKVEKIRDNPLYAMKLADEEFKREEAQRRKKQEETEKKLSNKQRLLALQGQLPSLTSKPQKEPMETVILEKTIIKLGTLLALGFGEAGANIVSQNMRGADSAGVNAMIPGRRLECIVGVCGIRDFSIATEVLQGKVLTFVNQIAEIVHGVVDEYHGAPNKNNGDAFLLIWRIAGMDNAKVTKMAEMSMIAFVKILGAINKSPVIADYRHHPGLQQRLGSTFRVTLTFGLHKGWAIEGAIGSEFKIDASYLSPNVNTAQQLEVAASMYGVSIMISEQIVSLTREMVSKCRLLDYVILPGAKSPIKLYTIDLDYQAVLVEPAIAGEKIVWNSRQRFRARQFNETQKQMKWQENVKMKETFDSLKEVEQMRRRYTVRFLQIYHMGYQNYSEGEWKVAKSLLEETSKMLGREDGPSVALLRFMASHDYEAPDGWKGYREIAVTKRDAVGKQNSE